MAWYPRSWGLIYAAFRRYSSKNASIRAPILESISRTNFSKSSFNKSSVSEFSLPIFSNSSLQNRLKSVRCNGPFLNGAKRFYSVSVSYSRKRVCIRCFVYLGVCFYVLITAYPEVFIGDEDVLETVPFTRRVHYMLFSPDSEKQIGKQYGEEMKIRYKDRLLPSDHPENIRVQRIARNIIEASQRVLKKYEEDEEVECVRLSQKTSGLKTLMRLSSHQYSAGENRAVSQAKGTMPNCRHLEGLEWEFLLVDDPKVDARFLAGGTIVIYTGFLKNCTSDAEIAFRIAHQVAHVVARHGLEIFSKFRWWWPTKRIFLLRFLTVDTVNIIRRILESPLKMRVDIEADRIGVLLMALAGYDPQVAPQVIKSQFWGALALEAILLSHSKFMSEATDIYRETVGKSSMQPDTTFAIDKRIERFWK